MKILFQGDSITDCYRILDDDKRLGEGYPLLIKAELGFLNPGKYTFVNKGIGGNRIVDLYARIKRDIINIKPDVMSILIGVNDTWHDFGDNPNGVDADKFFKIYSIMIEEIKEALPDIKIMIMEPFTLRGTANEENWNEFKSEVEKRAVKAYEIAEKYNLTFVPLQKKFDEMAKKESNEYWLSDGVHPTAMGHELIKREWIKVFSSLTV